jgi:hypothetical protein
VIAQRSILFASTPKLEAGLMFAAERVVGQFELWGSEFKLQLAVFFECLKHESKLKLEHGTSN